MRAAAAGSRRAGTGAASMHSYRSLCRHYTPAGPATFRNLLYSVRAEKLYNPGLRMSDRKYRQRGYQDEPREPRGERKPEQKKEYAPRGQPPLAPKTFNMPGFREVVKCARCGNELTVASAWSAEGQCPRCHADLHTCAQCVNFDTAAPFECQKPITARVSPKDA